MAQIYRVVYEVEVVVLAENEREAEELGSQHLRDEVLNSPHPEFIDPVDSITAIPNWKGSLPYGGDDNTTVDEYLEQQAQAEKDADEKAEYEAAQGNLFSKEKLEEVREQAVEAINAHFPGWPKGKP